MDIEEPRHADEGVIRHRAHHEGHVGIRLARCEGRIEIVIERSRKRRVCKDAGSCIGVKRCKPRPVALFGRFEPYEPSGQHHRGNRSDRLGGSKFGQWVILSIIPEVVLR